MVPREKNSRGKNNVTNLAEARQARALADSTMDEQDTLLADGITEESDDELHGNRRFDAEKVARIKAEIAAGVYKIDPIRVANKFIEHDRNQ